MKVTGINLVLVVLCALFGGLVWSQAGSELAGPGTDLALEAFDGSEILNMTVADRGRPNSKPLALSRIDLESPWRVDDRMGFPAEAYPLEQLFACLANLKLSDQVAESKASLELFGLDAGHGFEVVLSSPGGTPWRLVLAAPGGATMGGFLRMDGETRVFKAAGFVGLGTEPREWIRPGIFGFDEATVVQVKLTAPGAKSLVLGRDDKGIWREAGSDAVAPRATLEDLIGEFGALVLHDVAGGGEQLETGAIGIDLFDGEGALVAGLEVGPKDMDGGPRPVRSKAWGQNGHKAWVGLVDESLCKALIRHVKTVRSALKGT